MDITPGKYRTRDGGEATVLAVLDLTYVLVIGYRIIHEDDYSYACTCEWGHSGRVFGTLNDDDDDLMELME